MRCTAHNRRGEQCKQSAIPGAVICRYHGANRQVREAAARRVAEAEAAMMARQTFVKHHVGETTDPFASLQELVREMSALKNFILARIAADETQLGVLLPAWHAMATRLADTLVDMLRLDPTSLPGRQGAGSIQELLTFTLDLKPNDPLLARPALPAAQEPTLPSAGEPQEEPPGEYRRRVRSERRQQADQAEAETVARWKAIPGTDLEEA